MAGGKNPPRRRAPTVMLLTCIRAANGLIRPGLSAYFSCQPDTLRHPPDTLDVRL